MKRFLYLTFLLLPNVFFAQFSKGNFFIDGHTNIGYRQVNDLPAQFLHIYQSDLIFGRFMLNNFLTGIDASHYSNKEQIEYYNSSGVFIENKETVYRGGEFFLRIYGSVHKDILYFFSHLSGGRYWYKHSDEPDFFSSHQYPDGHLSIARFGYGINGKLANGVHLSVLSFHPIWHKNSIRQSIPLLNQHTNWNIKAKIEVVIDPRLKADKNSTLLKKGNKSISGFAKYTTDSTSLFLRLEPSWMLEDKVMLGLRIPFGVYLHESDDYIQTGLGINLRLYLPMYGRLGFYAEAPVEVIYTKAMEVEFGESVYSIKPGIGLTFFLNRNLAFEWSYGRPFIWEREIDEDSRTPKNKIYRTAFNSNLRYFF